VFQASLGYTIKPCLKKKNCIAMESIMGNSNEGSEDKMTREARTYLSSCVQKRAEAMAQWWRTCLA
jgi:hypothetical protein